MGFAPKVEQLMQLVLSTCVHCHGSGTYVHLGVASRCDPCNGSGYATSSVPGPKGVLLIETDRFADSRGFFEVLSSVDATFADWMPGKRTPFVQTNLAVSQKGTIRGLHYQVAPHAQGKLVRCVHGAIFDVGVDIRPDSTTYMKSFACQLRGRDAMALYIPPGFAHGYQALKKDTTVLYSVTGPRVPEAERSLHFASPELGIAWPLKRIVASSKDLLAPGVDKTLLGVAR